MQNSLASSSTKPTLPTQNHLHTPPTHTYNPHNNNSLPHIHSSLFHYYCTQPANGSPPIHISQSAVMCRYLSRQLDNGRLAAHTDADDYRAQELLATCVDAITEGCTAWHAIDTTASYTSQQKETQPFIDTFVSERLPKWLTFFETALKANGGVYFIGSELSYVDVFVFQWLHGVEYQCPSVYKSESIDCLRSLKKRVQKRAGIAERVQSRKQYDGTGPCF